MDKKNKMNNSFFRQLNNEESFYSFLEDIKSGNYPEDKHLIKMDLSEFEKFQSKIK